MSLFTKRETIIFSGWSRHALAPMTALLVGLLPSCIGEADDFTPDEVDATTSAYTTAAIPAAYAGYSRSAPRRRR